MAKSSQFTRPYYQRGYVHHNLLAGYVKESQPSGDTVSAHAIFRLNPFTNGDIGRTVFVAFGVGATNQRIAFGVRPSGHSDTTTRNKLTMSVVSSTGTALLTLISNITVTDNRYHTVCGSYNATTGAFTFKIDMLDADDTGWANRVATTGVLGTTANSFIMVGRTEVGSTSCFPGEIGFVGHRNGYYVSDWTLFFHPNGFPKEMDTFGWGPWGSAQPGVFAPNGDMEDNLGSLGAFRRMGAIAPRFEGRTIRSTKDFPQNTGGIVLALAWPRAAFSAYVNDAWLPQIMAPGVVINADTVVIDANGYAYKSGSYARTLIATGLPAKAATVRLYQAIMRWEDVAPINDVGMSLTFNYQDASNYWSALVAKNSGGYWRFDLGQYVAGVWTGRGNVSMNSLISNPAHFMISVYDGGDSLNCFCHGYETDATDDDDAQLLQYSVASRPLKTATGVALNHNNDATSNGRYRSVLVMDI